MRAAIVTIGTEITNGQIVDRNSNWLSKKLDALDISVVLHTSVPDETPLMLAAFKYASEQADLIFICGGLGPTVDDFTRDVIAQFVGQELVTDEAALKTIEQKISSRGLPIRVGHRRQAALPKTALALENNFGVAPGFYIEARNKKIWALPGPPKEIEAIWNDHVHPQLQKLPRPERHFKLQTWLCLGVAESEIAQIAEDFFNTFSFEKKFGYRIHLPYVEVKLWYKPDAEAEVEVEQALKTFTDKIQKNFVGHSTTEIYKPFLELLENFSELQVIDSHSSGLLLEKLQQIIPTGRNQKIKLNYALITSEPPQWNLENGTLRIESQIVSEKKLNWRLKTSKNQSGTSLEIPVDIPTNRSGPYTKLYALECLLLKASSKDLIT